MEFLEKFLKVKRSSLPGTGKGLYTTVAIPKGTIITEYKGIITTWENADHDDGKNLYIYYVSRNHVINANKSKEGVAQYVNDAKGPTRVKGITNNTEYVVKKKRVFVVAKKNIEAGAELFVSYGEDYWNTLRRYKVF